MLGLHNTSQMIIIRVLGQMRIGSQTFNLFQEIQIKNPSVGDWHIVLLAKPKKKVF